MLLPQAVENRRQDAGDDDGEDAERDEAAERDHDVRRIPDAERPEEDRGEGYAGEVLEDAPTEEGELGRAIRHPPPAAGDVDDDDR